MEIDNLISNTIDENIPLTDVFACFLSSSSESLLLLDVAGFFVEVGVTFGLLASAADDFLSFSSDESESDEDLAFF